MQKGGKKGANTFKMGMKRAIKMYVWVSWCASGKGVT
jgi:hypothetical protein